LPYTRNYWDKSSTVLGCEVIPRVMTCKRWERILTCLYLVDNATVERRYRDRLANEGRSNNMVPQDTQDTSPNFPWQDFTIPEGGLHSNGSAGSDVDLENLTCEMEANILRDEDVDEYGLGNSHPIAGNLD
jgi:hypothetical protein